MIGIWVSGNAGTPRIRPGSRDSQPSLQRLSNITREGKKRHRFSRACKNLLFSCLKLSEENQEGKRVARAHKKINIAFPMKLFVCRLAFYEETRSARDQKNCPFYTDRSERKALLGLGTDHSRKKSLKNTPKEIKGGGIPYILTISC